MVFGFPKAGEVYGSFDVVSSNFDANKGTWSVLFSDEIQKQYALQALKPFLGKVAVFEVDGVEHSVEFPTKETKIEYVRNNPPTSVQTLVHGRFYGDTAFQNPTTVEAFEEELDKMTVKKPTKWFRVHPITELHSPSFRNKLWSFVTRRGESYGWVVGKQIYHRKGSLIMPYVKINKHVENAKVMYHTHPSKDEPSFSSADDIQWYLDAAYKWNIRHFYTIMANRLDHFEITTKGDKGRNSYLRMDEGKFIDDLDTMLSKLEEQYKGDALSDEKFCEKVTRKWVAEMNERFGHIMTIKYHSHIKKETPLKNPGSGTPLGVAKRVGLDDRHISAALGELKGLDYDWIHYGGDEFAHTMYVYWWTKYHFLPKADGKDRLYTWEGLSKESRAKLREYLDTEIEAGWTRSDVLLMLGLYHDIAKRREKEEDRHHSVIGAEMFREEIAPEIGLSQNLTDHISLLLQSDVGRRGITEEEFQTIAGDLYLLCKIFHMADRTAHHPYMFTSAAATARQEGLLQAGQYGDAYIAVRNKQDIETIEHILQHNVIPNPPPKMPYNVQYNASYDIAIDPDTAEMLFEEYDPRKIVGNDGKFGNNFRMSYGQGIYIRMPLKDGYIATATLGFAYPAKLNILGIPSRDDYGISAATEVYSRVGQVLAQVYDVKSEELSEPSSDTTSETEVTESPEADVLPAANVSFPVQPMINPKHCKKDVRGADRQRSQSTIVIAGPMGSGRREVAKELGRHGYQICPMHTTQPSPVGRVPNRDSVDHDKESFMQLVKADQMPYWTMDEKGHCYGYTKEQLQAPKTVMYTSPTMALRMKDSLPHLHIVYLQNNQSPQQHEMKLSSRSGITPRQAKAASKFAYHQKRKASQFDSVVSIDDDDYINAASTLANPPIKVIRRDKTEDGTSHFYNADTDEDITGKSFDGATLDTNKDIYKVGDPTPIPKGRERFAGGLHYFNIAKWGDRKIIQYSRDSQGFDSIYVERVDIEGVVYLNSAPLNFREPSAHVMVRGRAEVDWESAKLVTGGEITDFDDNSKSHGEPDTVVKSVKIRPRERGPRYRVNPRIPKKYEGQDPSEHSDLYTDEDPRGTIQGLGFKDKETAERSVNIIKRSGKTHAHKIQAAMAMEQRARFHPNATPGIKAAQKVYANFIEQMKKKTKARRNPQFDVEGMQFFTTVPTMKHTNLGAVSAEIEVDRNIPKELVGNVKDIFLGLVEDYEKKTDKRTALAIAFAIDELTEETKRRGGNAVMNFTVETGGSLGLPIVEFNKTIPAVIIVTGDAIKLKKAKRNPNHCPVEIEARRAATDPSFKHHEWYIEHHLDYVKAIAHSLKGHMDPDEEEIINDMVWMHDYPKMMGDKDNFELVRNLVSKHKGKAYADELVGYLEDMEMIKSVDSIYGVQTTIFASIMSTADALAHYYGPFFQIYMDENPDTPLVELKRSNAKKLEKDKRKLRAGKMYDALDSIKFQYKGRKVRVVGNEHIAELIEKKNPPLTFEELIPVVFEISEDRQYTLFNRLIKLMEESGEIAEEVLIKEGFKPYKEPGKDGVEGEITDAIIVLLMAFERNGGTPEELKDLLYKSISKGGLKLKRNPSKTPEGRKIPKRYLKGLNKEEMLIAAKEIDKGYKYDINDPKAYEYWKSDIKATARGYKTVPSKYKKKFIQMYGPLPKGGKFLTKIAKATGIKKSILQKVYNKGLAAWRGGHRPGVQQHQWAAGRVYSFVTLGNTVKKGNKKMPDYQLAIDAGLIKANPRKGNKPTLEEFRQWVDQVNMKNKEIKAFMESDWFDVAGLTPEEAGEQGIFSGQDSLRRIIRMRKKLGLTGPKDYIKPGPQTTKKYYELALEKWTGLDSSVPIKEDTTDWGWMLRQNRFNGRAAAYPYNKAAENRRGPLVKKQKTQNKPSRKLLSLWVWGHDPWRWARKNGVANMPKCADVPWVGMTEKRKYGKVPVLMSPTVKNNPVKRNVMYHGSSVPNINRLQQNYNHLVGREVVFGTPNYEYALAMAIDSTNDDLEVGYINGQFTIAEVYAGAFELLKEPSYIYEMKSTGFHQHPRLPEMEYIIEASMPVLRSKRVPNTYKELKRLGTTFIPYR